MSLHWGCNLVFNNDCCHHQKLKGSRMSFLRHEKSFSQDLNLSIDWGVNHSGWQFMYARFFSGLTFSWNTVTVEIIRFCLSLGANEQNHYAPLNEEETYFFNDNIIIVHRKKINTHYQKIKTYFNFPWIIVFKQLPL